jgi:hypothetical protein
VREAVAEMVKKYGFAATLSELVFLAGKHITPVQIGFTVAYEKAEQLNTFFVKLDNAIAKEG